jgi:short-subunit dehydrogenase
MELGLIGKVALITGASRGIGAPIALEGPHVCLVARDPTKLNEVTASVRDIANVRADVHATDRLDEAFLASKKAGFTQSSIIDG